MLPRTDFRAPCHLSPKGSASVPRLASSVAAGHMIFSLEWTFVISEPSAPEGVSLSTKAGFFGGRWPRETFALSLHVHLISDVFTFHSHMRLCRKVGAMPRSSRHRLNLFVKFREGSSLTRVGRAMRQGTK